MDPEGITRVSFTTAALYLNYFEAVTHHQMQILSRTSFMSLKNSSSSAGMRGLMAATSSSLKASTKPRSATTASTRTCAGQRL